MTTMKRILDLILAGVLIMIFSVPMLMIALWIRLASKGPSLFWTDRVGVHNILFKMAKFRTMKVNAPQVATHLMENPEEYLIPCGGFLRKSSLDELPQLLNVLQGTMSFVGPRPALFNQSDLIELRMQKNVHTLVPGITGWAQVNGRDELPIPTKVDFDEYYLKNKVVLLDFKILFLTVFKVLSKDGVAH